MFDIGWQEILVIGVIALIVVGPKELPGLLRTIGRYAGMLKRQAGEFRSHFDQALREAELDQLKNDVTGFKSEIEGTIRDTARAAEREMDDVRRSAEIKDGKPQSPAASSAEIDHTSDPDAHDENGLPIAAKPPPASFAAEGVGDENRGAALGEHGARDDKAVARPAAEPPPSDAAGVPAKTGA
ncbi:MAG: twin-arginine translocase subunit TatB [Hyphomicrobiaceae bacterium]|nr:twin-arginine translocase subunit TatB [Hyphomicrobiaceae bacterium]